MALIFICPSCDNKVREIEQVMTDCIVSQTISFDDDGEARYGQPNIEDSITDRFQCKTCGHCIEQITDEEELYNWLKQRQ